MIRDIEKRFKEITQLNEINLGIFPIKRDDYVNQQQATSKQASKERGYITTPIFLVDIMVALKHEDLLPTMQTCDLCAGEAGQFTIRLMRFMYNKFKMDVNEWLEKYHTLTELAPESCATLVYIYGPNINLYCGDSLNLKYSDENDKGILFFNKEKKMWYNDKKLSKDIIKYKDNLNKLKEIFNKKEKSDE